MLKVVKQALYTISRPVKGNAYQELSNCLEKRNRPFCFHGVQL